MKTFLRNISVFIVTILFLFPSLQVSAHNMPMGGSRWCFGKNRVTAVIEFNPLLFSDIKGIKEAGFNPESVSDAQLRQIAADVLQPYINDKLSISVNGAAQPVTVTKLGRNENNAFQIWLAVEKAGFNYAANPVRIDYRLLFEETDNQHLNLAFMYLTDATGADLQKVLDFSQPDGQYTFEHNAAVWEMSIAGRAAGIESNSAGRTKNGPAASDSVEGAQAAGKKAAMRTTDTVSNSAPSRKPSAPSEHAKNMLNPGNRSTVLTTVPHEISGKGIDPNESARKPLWATIGQFILLGIEHILTGYDHMAFLLALIVIGLSIKEVLKIITAFTIAHSMTLLLAALQIVSVNSRLVEIVIALSICYVALENLFRKKVQYRWLVTFGFGLVHGFGFASALQELIVGKSNLLVSVVSFNLGVELGQIMIFLVMLPVLHLLKNRIEFRKVTIGASLAVFLLGFTWLIERGFNLKLLPI